MICSFHQLKPNCSSVDQCWRFYNNTTRGANGKNQNSSNWGTFHPLFSRNWKFSSSYPSSNYRGSTVFPTSTKYAYLYLVCKVPVFITFACSSTISGYEGICILSCSRHFSNSSCHPLWPHLAETLLQAFPCLFFLLLKSLL